MTPHDYAIVAPDGTVLLTTNVRASVLDLAGGPRFDGVPCRWAGGGWQPID